MQQEKDSRLDNVMREIVQNSDRPVEQMLLYDLLSRNHLEVYLKNSLKQIEGCLEKSMVDFVKSSEYIKAKNMFQEKEMDYQTWQDKFGHQVKSLEERVSLQNKLALEKELQLQKDKPSKSNQWNDVKGNGNSLGGNSLEQKTESFEKGSRRKRKRDKRSKRNKHAKGHSSRGGVKKWVESHDIAPSPQILNISSNALHNPSILNPQIQEALPYTSSIACNSPLLESLRVRNLTLDKNKASFADLMSVSKFSPSKVLQSDSFISNISFKDSESGKTQGWSGTSKSPSFILENLERLFTVDKQNLILEVGEEIRPEILIPMPSEMSIEISDYMTQIDLDPLSLGMMTDSADVSQSLLDCLSNKSIPGPEMVHQLSSIFGEHHRSLSVATLRQLLLTAKEDHVDLVTELFLVLKKANPGLFSQGLELLCLEDPVRLFSIHMMYKFHKLEIGISRELMDKFLGSWFDYCLADPKEEELMKSHISKKKILIGFISHTIKLGKYDLTSLVRQVDAFCSKNTDLKGILKMKTAIDEHQKSLNKRRKKI